MRCIHRIRIPSLLALIIFTLPILPESAMAKHQADSYPESGKVVATGLNEHTKSHPSWTNQNGASHGGGTYSVYSHTYKVETDTMIYELDCGKVPTFHKTGKGCGGEKELQVGDVIQFRTEKESFYIPIADGSEQKLRILNKELKSDAKQPDNAKP